MFTFFVLGLLPPNPVPSWAWKSWRRSKRKNSALDHFQCSRNQWKTTHKFWLIAEIIRNSLAEFGPLIAIVIWCWRTSRRCGRRCRVRVKAKRLVYYDSLGIKNNSEYCILHIYQNYNLVGKISTVNCVFIVFIF